MGYVVALFVYSTDIVTYLQSSGHWGCTCEQKTCRCCFYWAHSLGDGQRLKVNTWIQMALLHGDRCQEKTKKLERNGGRGQFQPGWSGKASLRGWHWAQWNRRTGSADSWGNTLTKEETVCAKALRQHPLWLWTLCQWKYSFLHAFDRLSRHLPCDSELATGDTVGKQDSTCLQGALHPVGAREVDTHKAAC